jgi:hypothetical protein
VCLYSITLILGTDENMQTRAKVVPAFALLTQTQTRRFHLWRSGKICTSHGAVHVAPEDGMAQRHGQQRSK